MEIELFGGPLDGMVADLPEAHYELKIPVYNKPYTGPVRTLEELIDQHVEIRWFTYKLRAHRRAGGIGPVIGRAYYWEGLL